MKHCSPFQESYLWNISEACGFQWHVEVLWNISEACGFHVEVHFFIFEWFLRRVCDLVLFCFNAAFFMRWKNIIYIIRPLMGRPVAGTQKSKTTAQHETLHNPLWTAAPENRGGPFRGGLSAGRWQYANCTGGGTRRIPKTNWFRRRWPLIKNIL